MIVDTSAIIALFVRAEPAHESVAAAIADHHGRLVVSPLVLAEVDFLISTRISPTAAVAAMRELSSGAWELAGFGEEDLVDAMNVVERFPSLGIGATDASLVVLAHRYRTHAIATLDRRHFGALRAIDGRPFELVPAP